MKNKKISQYNVKNIPNKKNVIILKYQHIFCVCVCYCFVVTVIVISTFITPLCIVSVNKTKLVAWDFLITLIMI